VDNARIADRLEAFASLLELADANPYTARAYSRAAETIRGAPIPVAGLVRTGRVRELRGIGPGIEARLRELVETGEIAELTELERELAPGLVGLGRYLGLTARRSVEIARALGVSTPDELREAAAAGRLRTVPGIGPKTDARLLEALAREAAPRPQRGLLLNRARELVVGIATALDGEAAGDVRRWRDSCELLSVVCAARDPAALLARFAALPQIVSVVEQDGRRAVGVTVEGVPVELVVAEPERFGTALVRATGSPAYVAALEPLPDAPDEAAVYDALDREGEPRPRRGLLLNRAWELVGGIAAALDGEAAGDVRRWRDSCERLAVVCPAADPGSVVERFAALPQIVALVEHDERRALGVTVEGVPVELVASEPERFGTALIRATGSPAYVAALEPLPGGPDEEAVYRALELDWCPPELREEPFRGQPPVLLEPVDIRGDLHCHTTWSDGRASVEEMARAARERGYDYVAICDHTPAVGAVRGLTPDDVRRQAEEIAAANELLAPFRVLRGIECDILPDGRLDLPDDVLAELEWVQASVHGGQRMPGPEMTKRVEAALRNPHVRCLSHPTGRYINRRPENALDLERIFEVALEEGVAVEVNGLPDRLDLRGEHVRNALRAGVEIVCSTDAHSIRGLGNMPLSIATARRGWATAADVVNTRPLDAILS